MKKTRVIIERGLVGERRGYVDGYAYNNNIGTVLCVIVLDDGTFETCSLGLLSQEMSEDDKKRKPKKVKPFDI